MGLWLVCAFTLPFHLFRVYSRNWPIRALWAALRCCRGSFINKEDQSIWTLLYRLVWNYFIAILLYWIFFHCFHLSRADFALFARPLRACLRSPEKVKSSACFTGYIIKNYIDLIISLPTGANPGEWWKTYSWTGCGIWRVRQSLDAWMGSRNSRLSRGRWQNIRSWLRGSGQGRRR